MEIIWDRGVPTATVELDRRRILRLDFAALMLIEQALGIQILSGGDAATRRLTSGLSLADLVAILVAMARDEDPEVDPATIRRYLSLARVAEITALFSSLFMATLPPTTPPLPAAAKQME